jgi:high-affinity nickel-transport protein
VVTTTSEAPTAPAGRLVRVRRSLTPAEWSRVGGMVGFIALLHIVGWGVLLLLVVPSHYQVGTGLFGVGTGLTAYTLGLRHAFDADHIAAIDNTTRKLMAEGRRPLSVGFWFSLGHSSVVVALTLLLGIGLKAVGAELSNDSSALHTYGGLIGTAVSGGFLYLIGIINLVLLIGIVKVFRDMRRGTFDEATLEEHLNKRGFLNRFLGRAVRAITKPWQIYPVGLLFGLGFDTVTEVTLLVLAGTSVAAGLPWYAIMCLPILFAAGMSLLDTIDGSFMNFAYGWAFSKPVRKVYYNITITGLSVAVALLIGTVELLSIAADRLHLTGGLWDWVAGVDLNTLGFGIVGVFAVVWVIALLVWKLGRVEQRWTQPDGE